MGPSAATPESKVISNYESTELAQIAAREGVDSEHLMKDAAPRLVEGNARFRANVQEGIEAADRGEFVDNQEVWARVHRLLKS